MGKLPQGTEKLHLFKWNKLPVILQAEAAECGLACLAMVAGFHGYNVSLSELRRKFTVSLKGINLKSLSIAADQIGLSGRALRLDIEDLKQVKTPAILYHPGLKNLALWRQQELLQFFRL